MRAVFNNLRRLIIKHLEFDLGFMNDYKDLRNRVENIFFLHSREEIAAARTELRVKIDGRL